ncbi:MAG: HAMP domain-containing histidine kinase [Alphaproteobacteria bacterium]|nr:HAMP domain-containing histidine kinase [Alphaproteobacteria bacterium]
MGSSWGRFDCAIRVRFCWGIARPYNKIARPRNSETGSRPQRLCCIKRFVATAPDLGGDATAGQMRPPSIVAGERRLAELMVRLRGERSSADQGAGPRSWYDARWRSDRSGRIVQIEGGDGAVLPGSLNRLCAVSGRLAHVVAERWPFRDMEVDDDGRRWRLSALPVFDSRGAFAGYDGYAWGRDASPDANDPQILAEFAHEVRSPLTAISGFAQFVEGEALGPAPQSARELAAAILAETRRLVAALDDLTDNARVEGQRLPVACSWMQLGDATAGVVERYAPAAAARHAALSASGSMTLRVWADPKLLERCIERLVATLVPFLGERETLKLVAQGWTGELGGLSISRPKALVRLSAAELLDQPDEPTDASAPLLGLSFTLRLAQRLMAAMGGELVIAPQQFKLRMAAGGVHALQADVAPEGEPA